MSHDNNVNVNGFLKSNYNVNDNDSMKRSQEVEIIADRLLQKLGARAESRPFMCKVAWKLPENNIWNNVEQALKGKNPIGLFIFLCKRDGV